jgi:hypothetical protein
LIDFSFFNKLIAICLRVARFSGAFPVRTRDSSYMVTGLMPYNYLELQVNS